MSDQLALFDLEPPHTCHYDGCGHRIDKKYLMCGFHWRMVPQDIQRAVYRQYTQGQESDHSLIKDGYWAAANLAKTAVRCHLAGEAIQNDTEADLSDFRTGDVYRVTKRAFPLYGGLVEVVAAENGLVYARPYESSRDVGYLFPPYVLEHVLCGVKTLPRVEWVKRGDQWEMIGYAERVTVNAGYLFIEGYNPNLETVFNPPDPEVQPTQLDPECIAAISPKPKRSERKTQAQKPVEPDSDQKSAGVSDQAAAPVDLKQFTPGSVWLAIAGGPFGGHRVTVDRVWVVTTSGKPPKLPETTDYKKPEDFGHDYPRVKRLLKYWPQLPPTVYGFVEGWEGVHPYPFQPEQLEPVTGQENPYSVGDLVIVQDKTKPLAGDVCKVTQIQGLTVWAESTHLQKEQRGPFSYAVADLFLLSAASKEN